MEATTRPRARMRPSPMDSAPRIVAARARLSAVRERPGQQGGLVSGILAARDGGGDCKGSSRLVAQKRLGKGRDNYWSGDPKGPRSRTPQAHSHSMEEGRRTPRAGHMERANTVENPGAGADPRRLG